MDESAKYKNGENENTDKKLMKKFEAENKAQSQLLLDISAHLRNCMNALKLVDQSGEESEYIQESSIQPGDLRQMMRKVEDDLISQVALLNILKNASINNSAEDEHAAVF